MKHSENNTNLALAKIDNIILELNLRSVSPQGQSVVLLPGVSSTGLGLVEQVTFVDTSGFLTSESQTSRFSVFVNWVSDPVVSSISSDSFVRWVD